MLPVFVVRQLYRHETAMQTQTNLKQFLLLGQFKVCSLHCSDLWTEMPSYKITFHIRESSGCSLFSAIVTCQMITQRLHSRQHIRPLVTYVTNAASFRNDSFLRRAKLCFLKSGPSKTKLSASKSSVHHMLRRGPKGKLWNLSLYF